MSFDVKLRSIPRRAIIRNEITLWGASGFGSTNTMIRYFTKTIQIGNNMVARNDPAEGTSVTVLVDGVYSVQYQDLLSNGSGIVPIAISANARPVNTSADSFAGPPQLLAYETSGTAHVVSTSRSTFLYAGTTIRFHTDGTGNGGDGTTQAAVIQIS